MANLTKALLVLAATIAGMNQVSAEEGKNEVVRGELKLANVDSSHERGTAFKFEELEVSLEASRIQPDVGAGLRARLVITNRSGRSVVLKDPSNSLQLLLVDAEGYPVHVSPPVPRALINRKGDGGVKPQRPRQFDVVSASVEGEGSVIEDVKHKIHLAPAGQYALVLQIKHVLADPKENAERIKRAVNTTSSEAEALPALKTKAIPSGVYKISAILALSAASPDGPRAVLRSDYLEVSLGEEEDKGSG